MFKHLCTALAFCLATALPAAAVTVTFSFTGSTSANLTFGAFSYDDSLDGTVIGFDDLDSFEFTTSIASYDLDYVLNTPQSQYVHLAFDSATDSFQTQTISGFPTILSAISLDFSQGFFVRPPDNGPLIADYTAFTFYRYDSLDVTVDRTPISVMPLPAGGLLLLAGLGGFAALRRPRRGA